jgi:hypothetical protein
MNKHNTFKKVSLGLVSLLAAATIAGGSASAIPYNGDDTVAAPVPAFNVFTGVPDAGNESDFLRARVPTGTNDNTTQYVDPLDAGACTNGQKIQLHVYVHNGASADGNDNGNGPSVAHGTTVKVNLPTGEASSFNPSAVISSTNAGSVSDGATINCNGKTVALKYVAGSASQVANGTGTIGLSDSIVTSGASIKSESAGRDGDVWGCWNERVYVVLTVQVVATPPAIPVVATCDMFNITPGDNRTVTVNNFKYSASSNVSIRNVVVDWGDNSTKFTTTDASKVNGQSHTFAKDGSYVVNAIITFITPTGDVQAGGAGNGSACYASVKFNGKQPPIVTPPTPGTTAKPTTLVNTGAGSVAGLFAATTVAGAAAYRKMLARRLSDNV